MQSKRNDGCLERSRKTLREWAPAVLAELFSGKVVYNESEV
jgi:hypothetical protein